MNNYVSNENETKNLENAFKKEDKNATVTKSNAVYEVKFNGDKLLISNDYKYIEVVEPENISDWEYNSYGEITKYKGNNSDIIIPNYINSVRIKKIKDGTFTDKNIENITISEGIEVIDGLNNSNIKKCIIPNSVIEIGGGAFSECTQLIDITFGNNIKKISDYAFFGCGNLEGTLKCPDTLEYIGSAAFRGCVKLQGKYKTTKKLYFIGSHAFRDCAKITGSIVIPEQMTIVPNYVFYGCESLNGTITLHEGITEIEWAAFSGCKNLKGTLILPNSLQKIGQNAFYYCEKLTGDLTIPNGITDIPYMAFDQCGFDGTLTIPSSVLTIQSTNFTRYTRFSKVIIYNTEENIPRNLFVANEIQYIN